MPTPPGRGEFAAGEPRRKWKGQNIGPKQFKTRPPQREGASSMQAPKPPTPKDTSKPARPTNINVLPKSPGPFRPDVKLDRSQVSDRRGNSKRSGR